MQFSRNFALNSIAMQRRDIDTKNKSKRSPNYFVRTASIISIGA